MKTESKLSAAVQRCIADCLKCYEVCVRTKVHCLDMGGSHAERHHITLMSACADACSTSAHVMLMESEFQNRFCMLCADICERCAADCERFVDDDKMQSCALTCRQCAETCMDMTREKV
ncbi:MAG: four-helix bundle copper-binding protein [Candidatus Zixiibacteriota bacterium]